MVSGESDTEPTRPMEKFIAFILDGFLRFDKAGRMPIHAAKAAATFAAGYGVGPFSFALIGSTLQSEGLIVLDRTTGLITMTDLGREKAEEVAMLLDSLESQEGQPDLDCQNWELN